MSVFFPFFSMNLSLNCFLLTHVPMCDLLPQTHPIPPIDKRLYFFFNCTLLIQWDDPSPNTTNIYLKASNSVEARLESKENSESGECLKLIMLLGILTKYCFFLFPVTPSGGSDSVTGLRDSVSPALPAIDR